MTNQSDKAQAVRRYISRINDGVPARTACGIWPLRTVQNWVRKIKTSGFDALVDGRTQNHRGNPGKRNSFNRIKGAA